MSSPRERLEAERAAAVGRLAGLEREFGSVVESARQANTDDEHDPEGATIAFERQHIAALVSQARERLAEIDAALGRLEDGSYGRCARCGDPIPPERLAVRPAATACIRCAGR
ncbi:MAG: TraR/DksA C4-type zinc finger protein [Nocardiopsaceae bacterium]|jgi:RNA polymerase-binding transcription factor DksA|nr:TraR/DksA C4-type zinc finger protein [Nocardiopsaceae bacterium]